MASVALAAGSAVVEPTPTRALTLDVAGWSELPLDFERGTAGSNMRGKFITVGDDDYVWWSHATDTPGGVQQTGYDPGIYEAALSGMTGHQVSLPQGNSTPEDHAALVAAVIEGITGVESATARVGANTDGSWTVDIVTDLVVAWGTRPWASRGAAGLHGGHIYRVPEGAEASGWNSIEITRPISNRMTAPPAGARLFAVQVQLGDTVATGANNRPRLQYWRSNSDTTPAGTEMIHDFGQIPASQIVAGAAATIWLTPAQCAALRTANAGATGTRHWISAHAVSGTFYVGATVASGLNGEQVAANIRVETVGSNVPTATLSTWSASGELNFAFLLGARLCYEVDPCTDLEHRSRLGSVAAYATHPSNVVLPDTITGQRAPVTGLEGRRILSLQCGVVAGTARQAIYTGGTQTEDAPSMVGATPLVDLGTNVANGDLNYPAPTGASTVRVPTSGGLWWLFKGFNATGRGHVGPGPFSATGNVNQPSSWIRRFDTGGLRGRNPGERDIERNAGGYGNAATAFETPAITDPDLQEFGPDNHPYGYVEIGTPAIAVA